MFQSSTQWPLLDLPSVTSNLHRQHKPETGGQEPGEGKSGNHYQLAKAKALPQQIVWAPAKCPEQSTDVCHLHNRIDLHGGMLDF